MRSLNHNMAYRSFRITYSFIPEIWDRIVKDIRLDIRNSGIEADLHYDESYTPTKEENEILSEYKKHNQRLNLDVEDWFIHTHILLMKYTRIALLFYQLMSNSENKKKLKGFEYASFNEHIKECINPEKKEIPDVNYRRIIKEKTTWYKTEIKDIRDDLIQHETVPRFWGSSVHSKKDHTLFSLSRFRHNKKFIDSLYTLRDKYSSAFPEIKDEINYFNLLFFFEKNTEKINDSDKDRVLNIRKKYGRKFPDIPELFNKISDFLTSVNDYFILCIRNDFGKK